MHKESLFTRLSKYAASERVRPLENFTSELLAWAVNSQPSVGLAVAALFCRKEEKATGVAAETQRNIPRGFIDIWLTITTSAGTTVEVLIENKVDADLGERVTRDEESGDEILREQVDLYLDYAAKHDVAGGVALLTKRPVSYTPEQHRKYWRKPVSWSEVDRTLMRLSNLEPVERFVVHQMHQFFRSMT